MLSAQKKVRCAPFVRTSSGFSGLNATKCCTSPGGKCPVTTGPSERAPMFHTESSWGSPPRPRPPPDSEALRAAKKWPSGERAMWAKPFPATVSAGPPVVMSQTTRSAPSPESAVRRRGLPVPHRQLMVFRCPCSSSCCFDSGSYTAAVCAAMKATPFCSPSERSTMLRPDIPKTHSRLCGSAAAR